MNANKLADMLAKSSIRKVSQGEVVVDVFEIATMLRQQQAEIEALKNRNWDLVSEPWGFDRHQAKEQTTMEVMSEHCTCYKLGYSPLNDYAKVKAK
jgi:hypothetical protein